MSRDYINPKTLFDSRQYGFSQGVAVQGGRTIYLSGQVGWDANQEIVPPGDLRAQTWQAFRNIELALGEAGATPADVLSLRIYIRQDRMDESAHISAALRAFFPPDCLPASTWIGVAGLANEAFLIEVEAIAVVDEED